MFIPSEKKTDCYYYHEEQDMGAHIPTCNRYCRLGYCPCESCDKYLSKGKAADILQMFISKSKAELDASNTLPYPEMGKLEMTDELSNLAGYIAEIICSDIDKALKNSMQMLRYDEDINLEKLYLLFAIVQIMQHSGLDEILDEVLDKIVDKWDDSKQDDWHDAQGQL